MENRQTAELVDRFNYLKVFLKKKKKEQGGKQITDIIYFKRIQSIGSYELWVSVTPNTRVCMFKNIYEMVCKSNIRYEEEVWKLK